MLVQGESQFVFGVFAYVSCMVTLSIFSRSLETLDQLQFVISIITVHFIQMLSKGGLFYISLLRKYFSYLLFVRGISEDELHRQKSDSI